MIFRTVKNDFQLFKQCNIFDEFIWSNFEEIKEKHIGISRLKYGNFRFFFWNLYANNNNNVSICDVRTNNQWIKLPFQNKIEWRCLTIIHTSSQNTPKKKIIHLKAYVVVFFNLYLNAISFFVFFLVLHIQLALTEYAAYNIYEWIYTVENCIRTHCKLIIFHFLLHHVIMHCKFHMFQHNYSNCRSLFFFFASHFLFLVINKNNGKKIACVKWMFHVCCFFFGW